MCKTQLGVNRPAPRRLLMLPVNMHPKIDTWMEESGSTKQGACHRDVRLEKSQIISLTSTDFFRSQTMSLGFTGFYA